ncbi:MAG: FtsQ-type POTRA domain-containing protein [Candidatus Theseobacter exili]|nr:FtsQ-type POTRA domain-containing protein [Candidatus Theseobacter exili]
MRAKKRKVQFGRKKPLIRNRVKVVSRRRHREKSDKIWLRSAKTFVFVLLIAVLMAIFLYSGFFVILKDDHFAVKEIKVTNNRSLASDRIVELSGINIGENIFKVNLKNILSRIREAALVKNAIVRRKLPDTIEIKIFERDPIISVPVEDKKDVWMNIDEFGVVTGYGDDRSPYIPVTGLKVKFTRIGSLLSRPALHRALEVSELYRRTKVHAFMDIERLDLSSLKDVVIFLKEGDEIHMGSEHYEERFGKLLAILEDLKEKGKRPSVIDLRFNAVPVRTEDK